MEIMVLLSCKEFQNLIYQKLHNLHQNLLYLKKLNFPKVLNNLEKKKL